MKTTRLPWMFTSCSMRQMSAMVSKEEPPSSKKSEDSPIKAISTLSTLEKIVLTVDTIASSPESASAP